MHTIFADNSCLKNQTVVEHTLNNKLTELTEEELEQVTGGGLALHDKLVARAVAPALDRTEVNYECVSATLIK